MKPLQVRQTLLDKNIKIFSFREFQRIFKLPDHQTKYFLEKETGEGLLIRLKKGLYALKTDMPSTEEIANRLYRPSYISFEYALSFYNILPETVYAITSATTKPTREFQVNFRNFLYFTIKRPAYSGYSLIKQAEKSFLIAEPEKALADYLYFVALGKKTLNDRLNTKDIDQQKLKEYAGQYDRKKIFNLINQVC